MKSKIVVHILGLLLVLAASPRQASGVELGLDGEGQALIAPFWTVGGGHDTLISVRNNAQVPSAVKLRLIEADGNEALALNIYLDPLDTWAGALTREPDGSGDGGASRDRNLLLSRDGTCVLPELGRNASGPARLTLPELEHGNGYIEIIEMAMPGNSLTGVSPNWQECDQLAARFESGIWSDNPTAELLPGSGRLSASVQIINVSMGVMISPAVTPLRRFSEIVQHSRSQSPVPNLATAHTAGTLQGRTRSRICDGGVCNQYEWDLPVKAVASVLTAQWLEAAFVTNPRIGAQSEFVITRPLARYRSELPPQFEIDSVGRIFMFNRDGRDRPEGPVVCTGTPPPPSHPGHDPCLSSPVLISGRDPVEVIKIDSGGQISPEDALSMLGATNVQVVIPADQQTVSGLGRVNFLQDIATDRILESSQGLLFPGEPVIGFAVQQFANGTLRFDDSGPVLSNYRSVEPYVRTGRTGSALATESRGD